MDIHYNAFISYRHHPDDIKVASEIHRSLERFKIPGAIKKRGISAMRLFRDKDELPITSSLTSDIFRALENSDFLIVICSPHTKESIWVQREIETFLQTHSRDQVLTVLAAGEPYDVLPEILLYEDVVNPVTGQIQRKEYEPLSCDWRLKKSQAIREELPRLAAALLGCGYDELRQRQRQYRMRRTIALFSAALAASLSLAAYYIYTSIQIQKANDELQAANAQIREANVQIRENLDQALRNQSEYLASAAGARMEAGDRLTAIALTLAALPSEDSERPYVPEAERALSEALSSYESEYQIIAQGAFPTDATVSHFAISDDGKQLFIVDARMVLTVWDAHSFQLLSTLDLSAYTVEKLLLTASGNILIDTNSVSNMLLCYRPDGTFLWQAEHCMDMVFLDGRSKILMIQDNYTDLRRYALMDADNGEISSVIPIVPQDQQSMPRKFLQQEVSSGQQVLVRYSQGTTDFVYLLDPMTGTLRPVTQMDTSLFGDNQSIDFAALDTEGNVILMRSDGSGISNGNYGTFQITSPDRADLICYDAETLQIRWQSEITNYIYSNNRTIRSIPGSSRLLVQSGNIIQIHSSATGELLSQCQLPALPLYLELDAESNEVWGITQNGAQFNYSYEDNQCYILPFTDIDLDYAIVKDGCFVHAPLDSQVIVYRSMKDPEGTVYEGQVSSVLQEGRLCGEYMLDWTGSDLYMYDTGRKALLWHEKLDTGWNVLGFSGDGTRLWMVSKRQSCVAEFSVADGSRTELPVSFDIDNRGSVLDSDFFFSDDQLLYILKTEGLTQLRQLDLRSGETVRCLDLEALREEAIEYTASTKIILASESHVWILRDGTVYAINLQTGAVQQILSGITGAPAYAWNDARSELLVAADNALLMAHPDGSIQHRIDLGGRKAVSVFCHGPDLLALCDDGAVYRYDRQGNILSKTALELYNTFFSDASRNINDPMDICWWSTGDGNLIIKVFKAGNIIDCSRWQSRAFVPNMYAYLPRYDEIVCFANHQFHAYSRYTTRQQIEKGREALGNFRLTEDQLRFYGLG